MEPNNKLKYSKCYDCQRYVRERNLIKCPGCDEKVCNNCMGQVVCLGCEEVAQSDDWPHNCY